MYRTLCCTKCQETRQILLPMEGKLYIECAKCGTIIQPISNEELIFEHEIDTSGIYKIQLDSIEGKLKIINISDNERDRISEIFREEYARMQKKFKNDYERILEESRKEYDRIRNLTKEELKELERAQFYFDRIREMYFNSSSKNQQKEAHKSSELSL
jgi:phage FluMu protein Com